MKKLIVLVAAVCSAAVVQAGDWAFNSTDTAAGITDGTWTFGVSINKTKRTVSIDRVKVAPRTVTALDFSKPVRDENGDEWTISTLNCGFVDNNASPVNYVGRAGFAEFVGELTLPGEGLTTISAFALGSCKNSFGVLKLPSTLTSVGRMAFQDNKNITIYAKDFPPALKTLSSDSAFKGVNIVGDLDLTALEGTLASSVFQGCKNLTSVKFGPNLRQLQGGSNQGGAFSGCSSLTNVVFDPDSSFYLGDGAAFAHCTSLTEMDLSCVTTIWCPNSDTNKDNPSYTTFLNCTSLRKVTFSKKLKKMHHLAFSGCSSLAEIVFQGMPPEFGWVGYPLFKDAASGKTLVSTVMLDSNDPDYAEQKAAWDALTEEDELTTTSHWRSDLVQSGKGDRMLVMHVVQTATVTAGEDADRVTGKPGSFVFSRGEEDSTTAPLMIRYAVSGTAESGKSYAPLSGTFMIPSGEVSATLDITPIYDRERTEDVTVVLTITESGDYTIGDPGSAEIKVTSDKRFVKIEAAGDADEAKGTDGAFIVSRRAGDPLDAAITVNYTIGGTAVPGRTYNALSGSVTIPASEQFARIAVTPLYDPETTEDTTVVLTLADGEYDIGSPASAEVKVLNGVRHLSVTAGGDANMGTGAVGTFVIALGEGEATAADLTINYTVGGTAQAGQAYAALSGTATIKAGESSVIVQVIPLNDKDGTGDTSVSVSLAAGDYTIVAGEAALSVIHADSFGGWIFADGKITDGIWTFSASADKNRKMTVGRVSDPSPGVLSPLEFAKAVLDADNQPYQIVTLNCGFVERVNGDYVGRAGFAEFVGSLTLPEGLITLSDYSLGQCKNMTGVVKLPSTLTTIGRYAFLNTKIKIYAKDFPKGLKTFTNGSAFENVDIVGDLDLSAVVGLVPSGSFSGCTNLTSVKFGPGLTALEGGHVSGAFANCTALTNVVIDPAANVRFGPGAVFYNCKGLTEIDLSCCVNIYPHTDTTHSNMTTYATFDLCSNLRKVTFGSKVKFLHNMAFYSDSAMALEEVRFTGAPPEIVGVPYMKNPTKKVNNQTVYPTITTYISKKNLTLKNKAGKCWLDYAANGVIDHKHSTFAAEYVQYGTYLPDPSARPLIVTEKPGLLLLVR